MSSLPADLIHAEYFFRVPPPAADEDPAAYDLQVRAYCRRLRADLERAGAYYVAFPPKCAIGLADRWRQNCVQCMTVSPSRIYPEAPSDGKFDSISRYRLAWRLRREGPSEPRFAEGRVHLHEEIIWSRDIPRCICQKGCSCRGGCCACAGIEGCLCTGLLVEETDPSCYNWLVPYGRSAEAWPGDAEAASAEGAAAAGRPEPTA